MRWDGVKLTRPVGFSLPGWVKARVGNPPIVDDHAISAGYALGEDSGLSGLRQF